MKKFAPLFFFHIAFFLIQFATAQTAKVDSLYLNKIEFHKYGNLDSLLYYSKKLESSKDICYLINAYIYQSYYFYRLKQYDKSEFILQDLDQIIDSVSKTKNNKCLYRGKIRMSKRLFWIRKNQDNFDAALKIISELEKLVQTPPKGVEQEKNDLLHIKFSEAIIQNKLKMHDKAIDILNTLRANLEKNKNNDHSHLLFKAHLLNTIGNTHFYIFENKQDKRYLDSTSYYYEKAYRVSQSLKPLHYDSEIIYNFALVKVFIAKKEYHKALQLIWNYKNIHNGFDYKIMETYQKAICYYHLQHIDSSLYFAKKYIQYGKDKEIKPSNLVKIYDILSDQYNKLNKNDSAFYYSKMALKQYSALKRNKENTYLSQYNKDFNKAKLRHNTLQKHEATKNTISLIITGVVFFIIISVMVFKLRKEKKYRNELVQDFSEKAQVKSEKKQYNIDIELENKILQEIERIDKKHLYISTEFSVNHIADKLATNTTYISYIFNHYKKESFKQYYTKKRIDYILAKINNNKIYTKYTIQALAEEAGYSNASAFTRAFKKHVGITPSNYIKDTHEKAASKKE